MLNPPEGSGSYEDELFTHEPHPRQGNAPVEPVPYQSFPHYDTWVVMGNYYMQPGVVRCEPVTVVELGEMFSAADVWGMPYYYGHAIEPIPAEYWPMECWLQGAGVNDYFTPETLCFNLHWRQVARSQSMGLYCCRKLLLPPNAARQMMENRIDPLIPPQHAEEWSRTIRRGFLRLIVCGDDTYRTYFVARNLDY